MEIVSYTEQREPVWLLWYRQREIPENFQQRCCLCGRSGKRQDDEIGRRFLADSVSGLFRYLTDSISGKEAQIPNAADTLDRAVSQVRKIHNQPILIPYCPELPDALGVMDIVRFFGDRRLFACTDCVGHLDVFNVAVLALLLGSHDA